MGAYCQVTGKVAMSGNNVSHARNHTKRRFLPNLKIHKFWVEAMQRFIRLRVSANGMRTIDKRGIEQVLLDMHKRGEKILGINIDALQAAVKEKTNG
jgi:large subunit ribosomal protein L28